jgi:hypothetical protein
MRNGKWERFIIPRASRVVVDERTSFREEAGIAVLKPGVARRPAFLCSAYDAPGRLEYSNMKTNSATPIAMTANAILTSRW